MKDNVRVVVEGPRKIVAYVTSQEGRVGHLRDRYAVDAWAARYPHMEQDLRRAWTEAEQTAGIGPTMTIGPGDTPTVTVAEALDLTARLNQQAKATRRSA